MPKRSSFFPDIENERLHVPLTALQAVGLVDPDAPTDEEIEAYAASVGATDRTAFFTGDDDPESPELIRWNIDGNGRATPLGRVPLPFQPIANIEELELVLGPKLHSVIDGASGDLLDVSSNGNDAVVSSATGTVSPTFANGLISFPDGTPRIDLNTNVGAPFAVHANVMRDASEDPDISSSILGGSNTTFIPLATEGSTNANVIRVDNTNDINDFTINGERFTTRGEVAAAYHTGEFVEFYVGGIPDATALSIGVRSNNPSFTSHLDLRRLVITTDDLTPFERATVDAYIRWGFIGSVYEVDSQCYLRPDTGEFTFDGPTVTAGNGGDIETAGGAIAPVSAPINLRNDTATPILITGFRIRYGANGYTGTGAQSLGGVTFPSVPPETFVSGVNATVTFENTDGLELAAGAVLPAVQATNSVTIGPFQGPSPFNAPESDFFGAGNQPVMDINYIVGTPVDREITVRHFSDGSIQASVDGSTDVLDLTASGIPNDWTLCPIPPSVSGIKLDLFNVDTLALRNPSANGLLNAQNLGSFTALQGGTVTAVYSANVVANTTFITVGSSPGGTDIFNATDDRATVGDEVKTYTFDVTAGQELFFTALAGGGAETGPSSLEICIEYNKGGVVRLNNPAPKTFAASLSNLVNTGPTQASAGTLVFDKTFAGETLVRASGAYSLDAITTNFIAGLLVGGNSVAFMRVEPQDAGGTGLTIPAAGGGTGGTGTDQRIPFLLEALVYLPAGSTTVDFTFGPSATGTAAAVYQGTIVAQELS